MQPSRHLHSEMRGTCVMNAALAADMLGFAYDVTNDLCSRANIVHERAGLTSI